MKILIVDDDSFTGESLQEWLKNIFGVASDYISSPEEALKAIPENNYSLVFSDLQMPGMDGFKFQEEVNRRFPDLPFILVSGRLDMTGKIQHECDRRNIHFLQRPIKAEEVSIIILKVKMSDFPPANI